MTLGLVAHAHRTRFVHALVLSLFGAILSTSPALQANTAQDDMKWNDPLDEWIPAVLSRWTFRKPPHDRRGIGLLKRGETAETANQRPLAEQSYRRALARFRATSDRPAQVSTLFRLGQLLGREKPSAASIDWLRDATALAAATYSMDSVQYAVCNYALAKQLIDSGERGGQLQIMLEQAVRTFNDYFGGDHRITILAGRTLGTLLVTQQPELAERLLLKALTLTPDPHARAPDYYNLAITAIEQRHWIKARSYVERAVEGWQALRSNANGVAEAQSLLGRIAFEQNDHEAADRYWRQTRETLRTMNPGAEAKLAEVDFWLATLARKVGRIHADETITWLNESLALLEQFGSPLPQRKLEVLDLMVRARIQRHERTETMQALQRRMVLDPEAHYIDELLYPNIKAVLYDQIAQHDYHAARQLTDYALHVAKRLRSEISHTYAQVRRWRGHIDLHLNNPVAAEEELRDALHIEDQVLAPDHPFRVRSRVLLGIALVEQNRTDEALPLLNCGYNDSRRLSTDAWKGYSAVALAELWGRRGDLRGAVYYYKRALERYQDIGDELLPDYADAAQRMIRRLQSQRRYGESESLQRHIYPVLTAHIAGPHLALQANFWLARTLRDRGLTQEARTYERRIQRVCASAVDEPLISHCVDTLEDLKAPICEPCRRLSVYVPPMTPASMN